MPKLAQLRRVDDIKATDAPASNGRHLTSKIGIQATTARHRARSLAARSLLAQIFECDLDALIIELLVVGAELIAATGGAVEELGYHSDRRVRLTFEPRRAANID